MNLKHLTIFTFLATGVWGCDEAKNCAEEGSCDLGDSCTGVECPEDVSCDEETEDCTCISTLGVSCTDFEVDDFMISGSVGSAVAVHGNALIAGNADNQSALIYTKNPSGKWDLTVNLRPSTSGDYFGASVAIGRDTVVVGDPFESGGNTYRSGAGYVYDMSGRLINYLKASDVNNADPRFEGYLFGSSVAIASNGDYIAIGAGKEGSSQDRQSGAVYLFRRDFDNRFRSDGKLKADPSRSFSNFGNRVDMDGDTLVVSSNHSVYLFRSSPGSGANSPNGRAWTQNQQIEIGVGFQAYIGAISLDGNRLAIGTHNESEGKGVVYIYANQGGIWNLDAKLDAPSGERGDNFGSALTLSGDNLAVSADLEDSSARGLNGDRDDNEAVNSGAVYLFHFSEGTWKERAYLKPPTASPNGGFGNAVGIDNGTLVIGAPHYLNVSMSGLHIRRIEP